jgi:hypothetical protein
MVKGRIASVQPPPNGRWSRVRTDRGATVYMERALVDELEQTFGDRLGEIVIGFETSLLRRQVRHVTVLHMPDDFSLPISFNPDPEVDRWPDSDAIRAVLETLVERIPGRPVRDGPSDRMQRARRYAIGVLAATPDAPYHPDPVDEREFLAMTAFGRAR